MPYGKLEGATPLSHLPEDPDLHLLQNIDDFPSTSTFRGYRDYTSIPLPASSYAGSSYASESLYDGESSVFSGALGDNQSHSLGPSANLGNSNPGGSFGQLAQSMTTAINTLLSDDLIQRHYWNVIEKDNLSSSPISVFPSLHDEHSIQVADFPWVANPLDMQPFMAEMPSLGLDPVLAMQAFMGMSAPASEPVAPPAPKPSMGPGFVPYPSEFQQYSKFIASFWPDHHLTIQLLPSAFILQHVPLPDADHARGDLHGR